MEHLMKNNKANKEVKKTGYSSLGAQSRLLPADNARLHPAAGIGLAPAAMRRHN